MRTSTRAAVVVALALAGIVPASAAATASTRVAATDTGASTQQVNKCTLGPAITVVTFADLHGQRLANGDSIQVSFQPNAVPANQIGIQLTTVQSVTAKKELIAEDVGDNDLATVFTTGSQHGPVGFTLPLSRFDQLFFLKAKTLGVMCPVYKIGNFELSQHAGQLVKLEWIKD